MKTERKEKVVKSPKKDFKPRKGRREEETVDVNIDESKRDRVRGHNDIKWLTYNDTFAKVVARYPFGRPLGYSIGTKRYTITSGGVFSAADQAWSVPGVAVVHGLYTAGRSDDVNSPINYCALGIWTFLRHAGTGSLVDDPNDVAAYLISIGQLLAYLGWLRRIVASLSATNPFNLYTRRGLLLSNGLNYEDMKSHYADLVTYTTWFASQINNFVFPKLPYFENAYTQFHYVYKDESLYKGQIYMYAPYQFGRFDETTYPTGSAVVYGMPAASGGTYTWSPVNGLDGSAFTFDFAFLKALGDMLLEPLINSQATATLSAAILKAYGQEGLFRVSDIDMLDERLDVVMDPEIAMQFHNVAFYDPIDDRADTFSYQSVVPTIPSQQSPYLVTPASFYKQILTNAPSSGSVVFTVADNLLDCFSDEPSAAEILLASRHVGAKSIHMDAGAIVRELESHDAFLALCISVNYFNYSGVYSADIINSDIRIIGSSTTLRSQFEEINLATFTASPLLTVAQDSSATVLMGETHNLITVDTMSLKDIYLNNLMSLFNVPKFK